MPSLILPLPGHRHIHVFLWLRGDDPPARLRQTVVKTCLFGSPNLSRRGIFHMPGGLCAFNNPGWLSQGKQYARLLLGLLVTVVFGPIAPIILVASFLYFFSSWFVCKYVLLYVYEHKFETGGKFFPKLYFYLFTCLYIGQVTPRFFFLRSALA